MLFLPWEIATTIPVCWSSSNPILQ